MSILTPIHRSLTQTSDKLNNIGLENGQKLTKRKSSNKLGRKKSVSFSTNISIIKVDCWKKYNADVSESGCLAWDIKKNEEKRREEEKRKKKEEEGCCIIY